MASLIRTTSSKNIPSSLIEICNPEHLRCPFFDFPEVLDEIIYEYVFSSRINERPMFEFVWKKDLEPYLKEKEPDLFKKMTPTLYGRDRFLELCSNCDAVALQTLKKLSPPLNIFIKHIEQRQNISLQRAWPKIRGTLLQKDLPSIDLPEGGASPEEIREWFKSADKSLLESVSSLDLRSRQLLEIPKELEYFSNLRSLDLSRNEIKLVSPSLYLPSLKVIDLSRNYLHSFLGSFLNNSPKIKKIDLSYNPFRSLPKDFLQKAPNLKLVCLPTVFLPSALRRALSKS